MNQTIEKTFPASPPLDRSKLYEYTQILHNLSQSLWLDNITRDLLNSGTLKCYLGEL